MWIGLIIALIGGALFLSEYLKPCPICELIPEGEVCWECGKKKSIKEKH